MNKEEKQCKTCAQIKQINEFYTPPRGWTYNTCRSCAKMKPRKNPKNKEKSAEWNKNNKDKISQYAKEKYIKKKKSFDSLMKILKQDACSDCRISYPIEVMDFDHRPDEVKKFEISDAICRAEKTILEEVKKCDLVCSNCHRLRTFSRYPNVQKNKYIKTIAIINTIKNRPCEICNQKFLPIQMDFDHIKGVKTHDISDLVSKHASILDIAKEIDLCRIICSNCHRTATKLANLSKSLKDQS